MDHLCYFCLVFVVLLCASSLFVGALCSPAGERD